MPGTVSALHFFSPPHLNLHKLSFQSHFLHLKIFLWPFHQLWSPGTSRSELLIFNVTATTCTPEAARILLSISAFHFSQPFLTRFDSDNFYLHDRGTDDTLSRSDAWTQQDPKQLGLPAQHHRIAEWQRWEGTSHRTEVV